MQITTAYLASRPALRGGALALIAALLFGVSTPLVQILGRSVGTFTTAALLYGGAAVVGALVTRRVNREARVQRGDVRRLMLVALLGAVIGPVALAWGLQHTSALAASLMLTLEALFTVVLARMLYRETMDLLVRVAVSLLFFGALFLVFDQIPTPNSREGSAQLLGLLAVLVATAAWGVDNTLSRALAERDPGQVVMIKAALGTVATALLGYALGESLPTWIAALQLLAVGATGYGLSLRFYLLAQRSFGAGRTGSVFAFAPFIGALFAIALGDRSATTGLAIGGVLMFAGVVLHLAERHSHEHLHDALWHEHAHRHDDGHHGATDDHFDNDFGNGSDDATHENIQGTSATHSHRHHHRSTRHTHEHAPDVHHGHTH